jgi:hypothetical protein
MGQPMQPQPKKKLSKGALWGIIGGAIALVLVVVGAILAIVLLGGPTKADYKEAADYMSSESGSFGDAGSVKNATEYRAALDKAIEKRDAVNSKLESMKAMRDPDAKKIYDEYVVEYDKAKDLLYSAADIVDFSSSYSSKCSSSLSISYYDMTTAVNLFWGKVLSTKGKSF